MSTFFKQASLWGTLLTLILVIIAFVRQLMTFVTFMMFILKAGIVLAFIALFALVALVIWRDYTKTKRQKPIDRSLNPQLSTLNLPPLTSRLPPPA